MTLEFNSDQQDVLDKAARHEQAKRLLPSMRQNLNDHMPKVLSDAQLLKQIEAALDSAAHWGVETRTASVNFVILWLLLGPDFDKAEPVQKLFKAPGAGMDAKVNLFISEFKWQLHQNEGKK
jgi:hypothetical protein